MSNIAKGCLRALALLLIALGQRLGLLDGASAGTLRIVVPMLALLSMRGERGCAGPRGVAQ
jgi:hypothetical protein